MEENHSYADIIGNTSNAPYMNTLAGQGALMTTSFAVTHPSEPNYMALFARQHVRPDRATRARSARAPPPTSAPSCSAAGKTFKGYSEGLPSTGSTTCTSGKYARKHSPWINFSNVPTADSLPFTSFPTSSNYASLPTLSFVIPNLNDDMHDGTITAADTWLNTQPLGVRDVGQDAQQPADRHLGRGRLHREQPDPDDHRRPARHDRALTTSTINHYNLLATLEQMYGLTKVGISATATADHRHLVLIASLASPASSRCAGDASARPRHRKSGTASIRRRRPGRRPPLATAAAVQSRSAARRWMLIALGAIVVVAGAAVGATSRSRTTTSRSARPAAARTGPGRTPATRRSSLHDTSPDTAPGLPDRSDATPRVRGGSRRQRRAAPATSTPRSAPAATRCAACSPTGPVLTSNGVRARTATRPAPSPGVPPMPDLDLDPAGRGVSRLRARRPAAAAGRGPAARRRRHRRRPGPGPHRLAARAPRRTSGSARPTTPSATSTARSTAPPKGWPTACTTRRGPASSGSSTASGTAESATALRPLTDQLVVRRRRSDRGLPERGHRPGRPAAAHPRDPGERAAVPAQRRRRLRQRHDAGHRVRQHRGHARRCWPRSAPLIESRRPALLTAIDQGIATVQADLIAAGRSGAWIAGRADLPEPSARSSTRDLGALLEQLAVVPNLLRRTDLRMTAPTSAAAPSCAAPAARRAPLSARGRVAAPRAFAVRPATVGDRRIAFHGAHQAGIVTPQQAAATFVSFNATAVEPCRSAGSVRRR